jgi:hypothetical protein
MHFGAGDTRKYLQRPGEIELRHLWKQQNTDLKRRGHGKAFRGLGNSSLPGKSAKRVFALDDPAIHPLRQGFLRSVMDAPFKPGHDDLDWSCHPAMIV